MNYPVLTDQHFVTDEKQAAHGLWALDGAFGLCTQVEVGKSVVLGASRARRQIACIRTYRDG
jgi:hypothetical protein